MTYPNPIYIDETCSTNSYLAELCNNGEMTELTCVYTAFQSRGRGQRGNSWESENGKNLLMSFVMYPHFVEINKQFILAEITALAIKDVLSAYTEGISIKWPNDIYWHDKKICGTLTENDLTGSLISRCISGSGINLNQTVFRSDAPNPISLSQITGKEYNIEKVLQELMERIAYYYAQLKEGRNEEIRKTYKAVLYRRKGYYEYRDANGDFEAQFVDVEPIGRLVLEDRDGNTRKYMFKEVEFVL